jgi:putative ABC transport system ATP-binding protein
MNDPEAGLAPLMLDLKDVRRTYEMGEEKVRALAGVTLQIRRGEYVAIMGPSGSGKSTLMNIIGCLDIPDGGSYHLEGQSVDKMSEDQLADIRNLKIGFVFQTFNLVPRITVFKNVELPLIYAGKSRTERKRIAEDAIKVVGLTERMLHRPNELSGGQRQRVAIARALVVEPALLLADEPSGSLDAATGDAIDRLLFELVERRGSTLVLVTHSDRLAAACNRCLSLVDGKLVG